MALELVRSENTENGGGIDAAAMWLAFHRENVKGAIIPLLRDRFQLTLLEAIEAAKLAHRLEYEERPA